MSRIGIGVYFINRDKDEQVEGMREKVGELRKKVEEMEEKEAKMRQGGLKKRLWFFRF